MKNRDLYYPLTMVSSEQRYTEDMVGELDAEKAAAGKSACWRMPAAKEVMEKKKIFVTDSTFHFNVDPSQLPPEMQSYIDKQNRAAANIEQLLQDGFEVYGWNGSLFQFKHGIDINTDLSQIQPIPADQMLQVLVRNGYEKNECYIADTYRIRTLGAAGEPWSLLLSQLTKLNNDELEAYLNALPHDHRITFVHEGEDNPAELERILNHPSANRLANHTFQFNEHTNERVNQLLEKYPYIIKSIILPYNGSDLELHAPQLQACQAIAANITIKSDCLEELMISRIVPIREIVSLDIQTSNLHKFRYETRLSHQASLKTILRNNPSLEEIKLYADEDSHFTLPELPKLETCELILPDDMMLKDVTYLANTISTVSRLKLVGEDRQIKKKVNKDIPIAERISKLREPIKSNEEVSSAVEKKSEQISPKDNTELPTLYSLKEIEISTKTINLNDLSVFLKRTPNCETLVLNNCQLRFDIPKGCLPTNIKKIVLNYENGRGFTANNCVNSLLSICPQLQELEIKTNTDVSASISDEKHNLQLGALEKLSCVAGNRDITLQILDTASCLQYLELKEFKFEDISVPMPQLKHLKIVSAIGILFFKKLHLFPNISILDLSAACMFDTFMFSLMPQLETLKLPLIDLSFASSAEGGNHLPHIVNACTNIKYLDIGRNVIKKEMISAMSLQRLEVLNLKDAKQLSVNTIEAAIHQFPRLTTIVLPADFDPRRLFQIRPKYPHLHFHCDEKRFAPKAPDAQAGIGLPGTATGGGNLNDILTRERQSRLDADTGGPGSSYVVQQIFYPKQNPLHDPLPNLYRLAAKTFQGIGQDGKPVFAPQYYFEEITVPLKYTTEEIMVDYKQIYARDDKTYLGKLKLDLKYGERHIMFPGLSNDDQLFGVAIDPPIAGHFERCPITRLHRFVRDDNEPCSITINYLLKTNFSYAPAHAKHSPEEKLACERQYSIPVAAGPKPSIADLVTVFRNFGIASLTKKTDEKPKDLANHILSERKGKCRHRAEVMNMLAMEYDYPVVCFENELHEFVDIRDPAQNKWLMADLGGPVGENIEILPITDETPKPVKKVEMPEEIITPLAELKSMPPYILDATVDEDNPFKTWETTKIKASSMPEYCEGLYNHAHDLPASKRNMLVAAEKQSIESLCSALSMQAKLENRRIFIIDDLDDVTSKRTIVDNATGSTPEVDSPLAVFLKEAKEGDAIVMNWSNYQSRHVNLNSAMESEDRQLLDIPIKAGVTVLGIVDREQVLEEDFYSRFAAISQLPTKLPAAAQIPAIVTEVPPHMSDTVTVSFYDDPWQAAMLGKFKLSEDGSYQYEESTFIQALRAGKREFVLNNAPWNDPEFRHFMRDIKTKREVWVNGNIVAVPDHLEFTTINRPSSLRIGTYYKREAGELPKTDSKFHILNNYTSHQFLQLIHCDPDTHQLKREKGILEINSGSVLKVLVTDDIQHERWAKILNAARERGVKLDIFRKVGTSLPQDMMAHAENRTSRYQYEQKSARVFVTTDIDYTTAILFPYKDQMNIIHVNPATTYSDLIESIKIKRVGGKNEYHHQTSELAQLLQDRKNVILQGNLSPALAKQLESLFTGTPAFYVNGEHKSIFPGQLTLITNHAPDMVCCNKTYESITQQDIWKALKLSEDAILRRLLEAYCKKTGEPPFDYQAIVTMQKFMNNPKTARMNPLKMMLRLKPNHTVLLKAAKEAWEETRGFEKKKGINNPLEIRMQKVEAIFSGSPYVFVAGSSGVGKSTFFEKTMKDAGWTVEEGMDNLAEKIAKAKASKEKTIIFIDEATLYDEKKFASFESLFNRIPAITENGTRITIPDNVKFAFASNYASYKGRQQHDFFTRHGAVISFKELPDNLLLERVIYPVLKEAKVNDDHIAAAFLKCYHHINQLKTPDHPMTARNLQMMGLRAGAFAQQNPDWTPMQTTALSMMDEAGTMLSKNQSKTFAKWIEGEFKIDIKDLRNKAKAETPTEIVLKPDSVFQVTKRRRNPLRLFEQAFKIRDLRNKQPQLAASGTAGLLLEGEPGIGKTKIAEAFLISKGFTKRDPCIEQDTTKTYYILNAGKPEVMKATLERAYHEGAVVIINEINTLKLESILNPLLSGKDSNGNPPARPGFFIIGTQNPPTYSNREQLSPALINRMQMIKLKQYTRDELIHITKDEKVVDQYLIARAYALKKKLQPLPTPRNLFRYNK